MVFGLGHIHITAKSAGARASSAKHNLVAVLAVVSGDAELVAALGITQRQFMAAALFGQQARFAIDAKALVERGRAEG